MRLVESLALQTVCEQALQRLVIAHSRSEWQSALGTVARDGLRRGEALIADRLA
jgi:hypothetical protein